MQVSKLMLMMTVLNCLVCIAAADFNELYHAINGYLCINSAYTKSYSDISELSQCAFVCCLQGQSCQAFTMADGPCQLFVFDKCSKSVRDCSCTRRGQVFVKQQPGLQPGALCPSGYLDDLCGVKYKMYSGTGVWLPSRQKCESERGLVIMADVIDSIESNHVYLMYDKYGTDHFWLGGYQTPGSPEPAGGWYWVGCNITIDNSLWAVGEPNNGGQEGENVACAWRYFGRVNDAYEANEITQDVLCECLSPFD